MKFYFNVENGFNMHKEVEQFHLVAEKLEKLSIPEVVNIIWGSKEENKFFDKKSGLFFLHHRDYLEEKVSIARSHPMGTKPSLILLHERLPPDAVSNVYKLVGIRPSKRLLTLCLNLRSSLAFYTFLELGYNEVEARTYWQEFQTRPLETFLHQLPTPLFNRLLTLF